MFHILSIAAPLQYISLILTNVTLYYSMSHYANY